MYICINIYIYIYTFCFFNFFFCRWVKCLLSGGGGGEDVCERDVLEAKFAADVVIVRYVDPLHM
jgi:hypothetical protein